MDKVYIYVIIGVVFGTVFLYEIYKFTTKKNDPNFLLSRTNLIYSNYEIDNRTDNYIAPNIEFCVYIQDPTRIINAPIFKYLRSPLAKTIAIYSKRTIHNTEVLVNTTLVPIVRLNNRIKHLIDRNHVIVLDATHIIKYYFKLLDNVSYEDEVTKLQESNDLFRIYNIDHGMIMETIAPTRYPLL